MSAANEPDQAGAPVPGKPALYYWLPSLLAVAIVILALYMRHRAQEQENASRVRLFQQTTQGVMGSGCHVTFVVTPKLKGTPQECFDAALVETKRAEKLLSYYDPKSDVSRINAAPAGTLVAVHPLTWQTLMEAIRFSVLSGGAFDPATGSVTRLYRWSNQEEQKLPDKEATEKAKAATGEGNILLDREGMRVGRKTPDTLVDLGGLAQGLGTDIFLSVLYERGVRNAVVEIGGEVKVLGWRPLAPEEAGGASGKRRLWNVGMRDPRDADAMRKLAVRSNFAVSTSGDYEKFFEFKGKRYSHIIDPRSGQPISGGIISATVIVPGSCMRADALATIACVLGEKKFRALLKELPTVEAYLIDEKRNLIHIPAAEEENGSYLAQEDEDIEEDSTEPEERDDEVPEKEESNFWPIDAGYNRQPIAPPAVKTLKKPTSTSAEPKGRVPALRSPKATDPVEKPAGPSGAGSPDTPRNTPAPASTPPLPSPQTDGNANAATVPAAPAAQPAPAEGTASPKPAGGTNAAGN